MHDTTDSLPSRKSTRLQGYDYRQGGAYFVTICTAGKHCLFGQIVDGSMVLTGLEMIVEGCWQQIPAIRANIELDKHVIMPNHLHGILFILRNSLADSMTKSLQGDSLGAIAGHSNAPSH